MLQGAGDPQLLALPGGTTLMYYGADFPGKGFGSAVARSTANPVSGAGGAGTAATTTVLAKKPLPAKKPAPAKK